jgi:hypothetical protein
VHGKTQISADRPHGNAARSEWCDNAISVAAAHPDGPTAKESIGTDKRTAAGRSDPIRESENHAAQFIAETAGSTKDVEPA